MCDEDTGIYFVDPTWDGGPTFSNEDCTVYYNADGEQCVSDNNSDS